MNYEQRLERIETTLDAMQKAMSKLQPLPQLTDEHSPEVVRPQWGAIPEEEKKAGWWGLENRSDKHGFPWNKHINPRFCGWSADWQYRIVKTERHPDNDRHARTKLEWDKVKDAGTHELWVQHAHDHDSQWRLAPISPAFCSNNDYEIRSIAKKKIDKSKLPVGAMTNWGRLMDHKRDSCRCWSPELETTDVSYENLRIVPMTQWEVLQDGDVIPEGVEAKQLRVGDIDNDVYLTVYRITGIASGWSDE